MSLIASTPLLARASLLIALAASLAIAHPPGLNAGPDELGPPAEFDDPAREFDMLEHPDFRIIPLQEAAQRAGERFRGRLIAARLRPPRPEEQERGVELVHELRLLTPGRDVLLIRLDARTGDFLEVRGAGLVEARRRNGDKE